VRSRRTGRHCHASISGYYLRLARSNPEGCGPIVVEELLVVALVHATYDTVVTHVEVVGPTLVVFVVRYGLLPSSSTGGSLGTATCANERSKRGPRTSRIELESSRA
jgi:hypothetical protein